MCVRASHTFRTRFLKVFAPRLPLNSVRQERNLVQDMARFAEGAENDSGLLVRPRS